MAKAKQMLYTQDGYDALVEELNYLKNIRREEIKNDIAVARSFGDLSENAEYDEARNEQAKIENRIKELEELIQNAEISNEDDIDESVIGLGSFVKMILNGNETAYSIVGSNEANPFENKISDMSLIGKALIGKTAGSELQIKTNAGQVEIKVLEVTRAK